MSLIAVGDDDEAIDLLNHSDFDNAASLSPVAGPVHSRSAIKLQSCPLVERLIFPQSNYGEFLSILTPAGLYWIPHNYSSGLEYIGQNGRSLCGQISVLARNTYKAEMPYRDPPTAAP